MTIRLAGKSAIITGGASGLGFSLAGALVDEGVNVVICGRRQSELEHAAQQLSAAGKGKVLAQQCDVRTKAQVEAVAETCRREFGAVDILINNAGLAIPSTVEECSESDWDSVIETNLKGTFLFSQAVVPWMKAQGSGCILNIASQAALRGYANVASYCASKHAILGFADALEKEVKGDGIRVHSLCPGLIQVPPPGSEAERNLEILQLEDVVSTAIFVLTRAPHIKLDNIGMFNRNDSNL